MMKRMIIIEVTRGGEDRFMNNVDKCQVIGSKVSVLHKRHAETDNFHPLRYPTFSNKA